MGSEQKQFFCQSLCISVHQKEQNAWREYCKREGILCLWNNEEQKEALNSELTYQAYDNMYSVWLHFQQVHSHIHLSHLISYSPAFSSVLYQHVKLRFCFPSILRNLIYSYIEDESRKKMYFSIFWGKKWKNVRILRKKKHYIFHLAPPLPCSYWSPTPEGKVCLVAAKRPATWTG